MSGALSDAQARLHTLFRRTAYAAATAVFVVIVASAFMRHTQAGLGCDDWPACYGRGVVASAPAGAPDATGHVGADAAGNPGSAATPSTGVRVARLAHRVAATGVLALVIGLLLVAWTQRPLWKREGALATAALLVAGVLAVLGVATPGAMLPAVTLGNLLGGYLMLALLAATWASARLRGDESGDGDVNGAAPARSALPHFAIVLGALALVFAQAWFGGTIGAQYALTACPTLGACSSTLPDTDSAAGAFDLLRPLAIANGRVVPPADAAHLHLVHRALGIVVVVVALVAAYTLRRRDRDLSRLIVRLVFAAFLLGMASILAMPSLPLAVLHNAATALLVAALAAAAVLRADVKQGSGPAPVTPV
jgi:cytochrome c oxidase assembly protein subunit 15